jgi:hypothetical protein
MSVEVLRHAVLTVMERDAVFDVDPVGTPELVTADYRRAILAALTVGPTPDQPTPDNPDDAEALAVAAGWAACRNAIITAIAGAWQHPHTTGTDHDPAPAPKRPGPREILPGTPLTIHPVQVRPGVWQLAIPYGSGTHDLIAAVALLPNLRGLACTNWFLDLPLDGLVLRDSDSDGDPETLVLEFTVSRDGQEM